MLANQRAENDARQSDPKKYIYNGMLLPANSVIDEWGVNAVNLTKLYAFADGFHVNIYITLQGKI